MTLNNGLLHSSDVSQHELTGLCGTQNRCGVFTEISNPCHSTGLESARFVSIYIQVLVVHTMVEPRHREHRSLVLLGQLQQLGVIWCAVACYRIPSLRCIPTGIRDKRRGQARVDVFASAASGPAVHDVCQPSVTN